MVLGQVVEAENVSGTYEEVRTQKCGSEISQERLLLKQIVRRCDRRFTAQ